MSFRYEYKGAFNPLLTVGKIAPSFDIDKLGVGKFHANTLLSGEPEQNGWIITPQYVDSFFERIRLEKRITILKQADRTFDGIFKQALKHAKNADFFLYFSHTADDGDNYFHKDLTLKSAALEFSSHYQNFSVFTITGKKATTTHLSGKNGNIDIDELED